MPCQPEAYQRHQKKAIQTYKDHLVIGLSSYNPSFTFHLWDSLLQKATLKLNLLRLLQINLRLSADAQLNDAFNFNRTLLAPPGTKVLLYEKPDQRRTWAPHGIDGWYLGGAMEHYRCYWVYIHSTCAKRIIKTVKIFPTFCPMPKTSSADAAVVAAHALADNLLHTTGAAPFAKLGNSQIRAIEDLDSIFDQAIVRPPPAPLLTPHVLLVAAPPSPRVTLSPSVVPAPSPRVPAPPIVCPNLIEPDDSDEPDPGPSHPRQSPCHANSQQCFAFTKSIFVDATHYLLAVKSRRQFDTHVVIDDVIGQYL